MSLKIDFGQRPFRKFRTAVYPRNMAPIGAKLCQNAFQVIPDISFFDTHKHFWRQKFLSEKFFVNTPIIFSTKCLFWRSCAGLHATIECSSKIHCQTCRFQPSTTLGGGVRRAFSVFFVSFGRIRQARSQPNAQARAGKRSQSACR